MHILIIDENAASAEYLQKQLEENIDDNLEIQRVGNDSQALLSVEGGRQVPDVIFIDLAAPDAQPEAGGPHRTAGGEHGIHSGIRLGGLLLREVPEAQIIFTSDSDDYCLDAYEVEHAWYLRKPVDPQLLRRAWDRAMARMDRRRSKSFTCEFNRTVRRIPFREILFFENNGRQITLHSGLEEDCRFYRTMNEVMEVLDSRFVRCHNSYIVNIDKAEAWSRTAFEVAGHKIPISRRYAAESREAFLRLGRP